jgi:hypothetical protein
MNTCKRIKPSIGNSVAVVDPALEVKLAVPEYFYVSKELVNLAK